MIARSLAALALLAGAAARDDNGDAIPRFGAVTCKERDGKFLKIVEIHDLKKNHKAFMALAPSTGSATWGYSNCENMLETGLSSVDKVLPMRANPDGFSKLRFEVANCEENPFMQLLSAPYRMEQCELSEVYVEGAKIGVAADLCVTASEKLPMAYGQPVIADLFNVDTSIVSGVTMASGSNYNFRFEIASTDITILNKAGRTLNDPAFEAMLMQSITAVAGSQYAGTLCGVDQESAKKTVMVLPGGVIADSVDAIMTAFNVAPEDLAAVETDLKELTSMKFNLVRGGNVRNVVKDDLSAKGVSSPMRVVTAYYSVVVPVKPSNWLSYATYSEDEIIAAIQSPQDLYEIYKIPADDRAALLTALCELAVKVDGSLAGRKPILSRIRNLGISNPVEQVTNAPTLYRNC